MNNQSLFSISFSNPLEKRIGKQFFENLPQKPGVYKMYGLSGRLLYVGKSKNLRKRVFTYRRANRGNSSRKVCRLVQMTHRIELVLCESELQALLKENELIRTLKPEFNRAKKSPNTYYYLALQTSSDSFEFNLDMKLPETQNSKVELYGAFKGHGVVRGGIGGLLRQLYLIEHQIDSPFQLPHTLMGKFTPAKYSLPVNEGFITQKKFELRLFNYLEGVSMDLLNNITSLVDERNLLERFIGKLILRDLKSMKTFFHYCAKRNQQLKNKLNLAEPFIPQEKLDDYIIQAAFID